MREDTQSGRKGILGGWVALPRRAQREHLTGRLVRKDNGVIRVEPREWCPKGRVMR